MLCMVWSGMLPLPQLLCDSMRNESLPLSAQSAVRTASGVQQQGSTALALHTAHRWLRPVITCSPALLPAAWPARVLHASARRGAVVLALGVLHAVVLVQGVRHAVVLARRVLHTLLFRHPQCLVAEHCAHCAAEGCLQRRHCRPTAVVKLWYPLHSPHSLVGCRPSSLACVRACRPSRWVGHSTAVPHCVPVEWGGHGGRTKATQQRPPTAAPSSPCCRSCCVFAGAGPSVRVCFRLNRIWLNRNYLQSEVSDVNSRDVMELLLITQYFDTLKDIGLSGKSNTGKRSRLMGGWKSGVGLPCCSSPVL